MGSRSVTGMLTLLRFIVSVLVRRFRSRAVLGEPRPAPSAARSSSPAAGSTPVVRDRPLVLGLALPIVAALSGGDGLGQAGNGDGTVRGFGAIGVGARGPDDHR